MRVVIVGGAGFLGSSLARLLAERSCQVCVLDTELRLSGASLGPDVERGVFDFSTDADASPFLRGASTLVHLGCTTDPAASMRDVAYDAASNVAPSVRLFVTARHLGVRRIVYASSGGTVYGNPTVIPVGEDQVPRPVSSYGVSKLAVESYLDVLGGGVSLRISNPYGDYQLRGVAIGVIARYINAVAAGEAIEIWGDGSVVRDYIHVDDVAEAFFAAISPERSPAGVYNIGSGLGVDLNSLVRRIFEVSGQKVPVSYLPGRAFDVRGIVLDSRKFRTATGWNPRIGLEAGLSRLWKSAADARTAR